MAKPFSAATRICDAVAVDPTLIQRLVAAHPALADDGRTATDGWSLTFEQAAAPAGTDIDALLAVANTDATPDPEAGRLWFEDGVPHLDVRGLEPPQPMVSVMRHLEGPETADCLIVHLDREPIYLLPILTEHGWGYEIAQNDAGEVRLAVRRASP